MNLTRKLTALASTALLVPLTLATGVSTASAATDAPATDSASEACASYPHPATGDFRPATWPGVQEVRESYPWNYLVPAVGDYEVCLDGVDGTNYDLEFLSWDTAAGDWAVIAASREAGSTERLTFTATEDNLGTFRVRVVAVEGYGAYTVAVRMPQDG